MLYIEIRKSCSLKSFFKDNEKTKDLFPPCIIRVFKNIGEKKKILNAKNFNGNFDVSSSFVPIFHRKIGREARSTDCFEMFEIPLLMEDKPG